MSVRDHRTYRTCVKQVQLERGYRRATSLHEEGESMHKREGSFLRREGNILEAERDEISESYS